MRLNTKRYCSPGFWGTSFPTSVLSVSLFVSLKIFRRFSFANTKAVGLGYAYSILIFAFTFSPLISKEKDWISAIRMLKLWSSPFPLLATMFFIWAITTFRKSVAPFPSMYFLLAFHFSLLISPCWTSFPKKQNNILISLFLFVHSINLQENASNCSINIPSVTSLLR